MSIDQNQLLETCEKVLADNRRGNYTIPAGKLYPHQWLWDSCFTAIGLSSYDLPAAQRELKSLLRGQWSNGMLPNMIFAPGWRYSLDRYFWDSKRNLDAPRRVATSAITQPPVLAEAVVQIGQKLASAERQQWYRDMYPALVNYHSWLYEERDPNKSGIVLQIHPYESGLDNTPPWVAELHAHHKPWWLPAAKALPIDWLINRFRRDVKHTDKNQRITNLDALLYIDIILRYRARDYQTNEVIVRDKFLVEDLTFNCVLIRANKHLQTIADAIDQKIPEDFLDAIARAKQALEQLWDEQAAEYYSRSFNTDRLIKESTIACLMPLYSGAITPARAKQLVSSLHNHRTFDTQYPVPSVPLNSSWFEANKYWQGPTWINTNWLIIKGLKDYGYQAEAQKLTLASLGLVSKHGCYEYFSAIDGRPLGAENFSWTAALTIDLLRKTNYYPE